MSPLIRKQKKKKKKRNEKKTLGNEKKTLFLQLLGEIGNLKSSTNKWKNKSFAKNNLLPPVSNE